MAFKNSVHESKLRIGQLCEVFLLKVVEPEILFLQAE